MKKIMSHLIPAVLAMGFSGSTHGQQCATNGNVFTPQGELKTLVIFVSINELSSSQGYNLNGWNNYLPDFVDPSTGEMDKILFNSPSDFSAYSPTDPEYSSFSQYLNIMSKPNQDFKLMGEPLKNNLGQPVRIDIDAAGCGNWACMNQKVMAKISQQYPTINLSGFDQITNTPAFVSNSSSSGPDNKVDYVVIYYRFSKGWSFPSNLSTMPGWGGSGGGFAGIYGPYWINGYTLNNGFTACSGLSVFVHELAHTLYNAPHLGGGNQVCGDYFYRQTYTTATTFLAFWRSLSALERWNLGYINLAGDVTPGNVNPGGYVIEDFIGDGSSIRIEIPFSGGQHLWFENHKIQHVYDHHPWAGGTVSNFTIPDMAAGAYGFIDDILPTQCSVMNLDHNANGIKFLNAAGNHDYTRSNAYILNNWGNPIYDFTRGSANPISGIQPLLDFRDDYDGNNQIYVDDNWNAAGNEGNHAGIAREDIGNGNFQYLYRNFGVWDPSMAAYARKPSFQPGDKLDMCSNPMIVPHAKFDKIAGRFERTYLNGMEVKFEDAGNMNIRVKVAYNKVNIYKDVRWACNDLALPDIVSGSAYDLILEDSKKITVNRSGSVNRSSLSPQNDFIDNTTFTIESGASVRLMPNSTLSIEDHSTLVIDPNTKIVLEENACLVIDETSTLHIKGNNIVLNGPNARIVLKGTLKTEANVDFTFTGTGYAKIYPTHQLDLGQNSAFKLIGPSKGHRFLELMPNTNLAVTARSLVLSNGRVNYGQYATISTFDGWVSINSTVLNGDPYNTALNAGNNPLFVFQYNDVLNFATGLDLTTTGQTASQILENKFDNMVVGVYAHQMTALPTTRNTFTNTDVCFYLDQCQNLNSTGDALIEPGYGIYADESNITLNGTEILGANTGNTYYSQGIVSSNCNITMYGEAKITRFEHGILATNDVYTTPQYTVTVGNKSCAHIFDNYIGIEGNDLILNIDAEQHAINRGNANDVTPNRFDNYFLPFNICYDPASTVSVVNAKKNYWGVPNPMPRLRKQNATTGDCSLNVNNLAFNYSSENYGHCFPEPVIIQNPKGERMAEVEQNTIGKEEDIVLTIFPNPSQEAVYITYDLVQTEVTANLEITDARGSLISSRKISGPGQITIEDGELAKGLYFVTIRAGEQVTFKKFIIN